MTRATTSPYTSPRASGTRSVAWSSVGLVGRQLLVVGFSLVLARLLGPRAFGTMAQAAVFMTLTSLLLDQGMTAALISAKAVSRRQAGAAATVNVVLATGLAVVTALLAAPVAHFFGTPVLAGVLRVLAAGLILKALAVVPRMLLTRRMDFRTLAVADVAGALSGGLVALLAALAGAGYWSLVVQVVTSDVVVLLVLLSVSRPPRPNRHLGLLRSTAAFGAQAFGSNLLAYVVQNIDNLLVGKTVGPVGLAHYALSYRVLTTPLQMVSQVVTRVLFPAVARIRHSGGLPTELVERSLRSIALLTFPVMGLTAVAAREAVPTLLGPQWVQAVPTLAVLAIGGARQSVTSVNTPVFLGAGRADVVLRLSLAAATVQISGILIGLRHGALGVAIGLTVAGFLVTPLGCVQQKRLAGLGYRAQVGAVLPALHGTAWAVAAYCLVGLLISGASAHLLLGGLGGLLVYAGVLRLCHAGTVRSALSDLASVRSGR